MVIVFFSRQNSKAFLSWNKIYFAWGLECIFLHIVYWQKWTTCKYVQCIFQKLLIVLCIGSKMVPALLMLTFASQWPPPWPGPRLAGCWWLGYVTSSTHVWHGNCTATGTWTPPCARQGCPNIWSVLHAYIANLLYSYYFLPLKLIITEFINTFIFCVLKCLYYLLLHRLPQLSTHTLNTRAWKHQSLVYLRKKRTFGLDDFMAN